MSTYIMWTIHHVYNTSCGQYIHHVNNTSCLQYVMSSIWLSATLMSTKERRTGRDENNLLREFLDNQKSNNGRPLLMRIKMLSRKQTDIKKFSFVSDRANRLGDFLSTYWAIFCLLGEFSSTYWTNVCLLGEFISIRQMFVYWANFRLWGDCLIRALFFCGNQWDHSLLICYR
jgi:hypothetical protein